MHKLGTIFDAGEPIAITIPSAITAAIGQPLRITAERTATAGSVVWHVEPKYGFGLLPSDWSGPNDLLAMPERAGAYKVTALVATAGGSIQWAYCLVTVEGKPSAWAGLWPVLLWFCPGSWGAAGRLALVAVLCLGLGSCIGGGGCNLPPIPWPTPTPPVPPVPPVPPAPAPGVSKVVLVYKVQDDSKAPQVWHDPVVQDYLTAKKIEWRALDPEIDASKGPAWVKEALTHFQSSGLSPPCLMFLTANGKWGAVAWPATAAEAAALLKQIGG